jgi:dipeptidyl aminopeptidase/acylaminoacyl peptidase
MTRTLRFALIGVGFLATGGRMTAGQAPAGNPPRSISLTDYYRLITVSAPALSPDGRQVVFVRTHIVEAENRRQSELWIVPADASLPPSRLTNPAYSATAPSFSPDGRLLAFRSARRIPGTTGETSPVWFLDMAKPGEAFQIPGVKDMPIWSPDGKTMAFTLPTPPFPPAAPAAPQSDLERDIEKRFTGRVIDWMNYRFDGRGYLTDPRDSAATAPRELYVVPREGGAPRRLTSLGVDVQSARWSPDGKRLAFVADTHQRDEFSYGRADLWTVALEGAFEGAPKRLTDDGLDYSAPAWTTDGASLVFQRQQSLNDVIARKQTDAGPVDLYRMPAEGGAMVNLTSAFDLLPGAPVAGPGGLSIYFDAGIGGSTHLFRVPVRGGAVQQVTKGERRLGDFVADPALTRIVYTGATSDRPVELYAASADGSAERRLTGFNDSLVAETAPVAARRLAFKSADGTPVEGWLLLPKSYSASGPAVPMILAMHGGPHGAYGNDFSHQFQLWAANGYAVLYTNPRGSTGYGEKFLYGTWGGWGVLDYQDVMAGVDHALANFRIDPRRLGVTGYSYGGFLTDWVITQTPRFAAAVAGAGISNWISDYGTADIPRTKESEFFGAPWEEKGGDLLRRLSPITYAGKVVTPTLFIHGEADLRVPIEQAEQMYTALKKRRVPARFVRYPDMYHGGWTPWNTVHRYHQEMRWWGKYLGALVP